MYSLGSSCSHFHFVVFCKADASSLCCSTWWFKSRTLLPTIQSLECHRYIIASLPLDSFVFLDLEMATWGQASGIQESTNLRELTLCKIWSTPFRILWRVMRTLQMVYCHSYWLWKLVVDFATKNISVQKFFQVFCPAAYTLNFIFLYNQ